MYVAYRMLESDYISQHNSTFQPLCYINVHQAHKFLNRLLQKQTRIVEEH